MSRIGRAWTPPPISALRAFEATARLLSFTRAAEELHVTQSAASHGVRELESRVGARLFDRDGRRLTLSDAGRLYLPFVTSALERLRAGDTALRTPQRQARVLTVSVSPSFATKWLVPRLGEFSIEHPDIDLRISAVAQHVDLSEGAIDLAVRHGNGNWPGLHATRLCAETLFPVCNPTLVKEKPLCTPADLLQHTLIHHRDGDGWRNWLKGFGVVCPAGTTHGPVFSEMSLAIDAAIAGQGVALARTALVARDLVAQRLTRAIPHESPADFAYWIVCPERTANSTKIVRFREWLLRQALLDQTAGTRAIWP